MTGFCGIITKWCVRMRKCPTWKRSKTPATYPTLYFFLLFFSDISLPIIPITNEAYRRYQFDVQFSGSDYADSPEWMEKREFLQKKGSDLVRFVSHLKRGIRTALRVTWFFTQSCINVANWLGISIQLASYPLRKESRLYVHANMWMKRWKYRLSVAP